MGATLRLLLTVVCVASLFGDGLGKCATAKFGKHGVGSPDILEPTIVDLSNKTDVTVNLKQNLHDCEVFATDVLFCGANNVTLTDGLTVVIHVDEHSKPRGVLKAILFCMPVHGAISTNKITSNNESHHTNEKLISKR